MPITWEMSAAASTFACARTAPRAAALVLVLASFGLAAGPASARLTPKPPKDDLAQPTQPGNGNGNAYGNDNPNGNGNANGHANASNGNGSATAAPGTGGSAASGSSGNATPGGGNPNATAAPTAQPVTPATPATPAPQSPAAPVASDSGARTGDDAGATLDPPATPAGADDETSADPGAPALGGPEAPAPPPPAPSPPPSRGGESRTTDPPRSAPAPAHAHVPVPAAPPVPTLAAPARATAPAAAPRTRAQRVLGRYHTAGGSATVVRGVNGAAAVRIVATRAQRVDLVASRRLVAGRTRYRVNAWLRTDSPGVMVCLRFFERTRGPKSRILRSSETCVSPTSEWQRFRVEALAVTRGNVLRVAAVVYGPVGGETFELSRLKIEKLAQGRWTKVRGAKLDSSLS